MCLRKSQKLCSDGTVEENGTIQVTKKAGANPTSDNMIPALKQREQRKKKTEKSVLLHVSSKRNEKKAQQATAVTKEDAGMAREQKAAEWKEAALRKLRARYLAIQNAQESRWDIRQEKSMVPSWHMVPCVDNGINSVRFWFSLDTADAEWQHSHAFQGVPGQQPRLRGVEGCRCSQRSAQQTQQP